MKLTPTPGDGSAEDEIPHSAAASPANDLPPHPQKPPDFSLVSGGPLFQLYRRMHLSGGALELLPRRLLLITLFTWLPLLFLSMLQGHAFGRTLRIPFLHDIEVHVRFLIALPILIASEVGVHHHIGAALRRFVERWIVETEDLPRFNAAVASALRCRNSVAFEATLLALVYTVGLWVWRSQIALGEPTWYAMPTARQLNFSLAGYWYAFVSIPIFQFIWLRWYIRLVIWFRLLWQISKLNLHLSAAHPDRAGGIGFLGDSSYAFGPLLFAQGVLLAGGIANRILYDGRGLLSFKAEAIGSVVFFLLVIFGPLVMFTPQLASTRRKGATRYGLLATQYAFGFEDKWLRTGAPEINELLGSSDIQSLSDMRNVYASASEMRVVPFDPQDLARLAAATAAPLLPLSLTMFSVTQIISLLVKIVFR